ncbi:hypothetical protein N7454_002811 [Penicillium verhagenii]|nr:hypothetical protein N7454_002811 [Penicillium verhagenii]
MVAEAHNSLTEFDDIAEKLDDRRRDLQDALDGNHPEVWVLDEDMDKLRALTSGLRNIGIWDWGPWDTPVEDVGVQKKMAGAWPENLTEDNHF